MDSRMQFRYTSICWGSELGGKYLQISAQIAMSKLRHQIWPCLLIHSGFMKAYHAAMPHTCIHCLEPLHGRVKGHRKA